MEARVKPRMFSVIRSAAACEAANRNLVLLFFFFFTSIKEFSFNVSLIFLRHREHCAHMKMIHDLISLSKILCFCVCLVSSCK